MTQNTQHYIGLMSGTSMDGVDVGLLLCDKSFSIDKGITLPFPPEIHHQLVTLVDHPDQISLDSLGRLDTAIGECFAAAVQELLLTCKMQPEDITAIGSHGQTIRHQPNGPYPFSMQIGDANVIAARTGITTVADFRRRDIALGGQGAPLAPAFHQAVFAKKSEERVVVNIGGMSNMTTIGKTGETTGHDTGPGNVLMDAWAKQHHGENFDSEGSWARSGSVNEELLRSLLSEDFFDLAPPKSTGRELFNLPWLTAHLIAMDDAPTPADVQTTLCELTARSIADAIQRFAPNARRCLVCGGGASNVFLLERLSALTTRCVVESTGQHGIAPEWVEAAAFAWLARQTLLGRSGNLQAVTGASAAAVLGSIFSAGHR